MNIKLKSFLYKLFEFLFSIPEKLKYSLIKDKYNLPKDFKFNGKEIVFYGNGKINIGSNSYIGSYSTIYSNKDNKVEIGNNCNISHNVRIYTLSNIPDVDFNVKPITNKKGDVIIGNAVWIGANVFINPGITIGENAIVGANSVVTKDIEPMAIYGGVPAKFIRYKKISE
jgi:maltose O-acetyltransferase